jgi:hypothetical protein
VAEWRVPKIVGEAERFGEILVEPERPSHRPPDLGDFQAMRQPNPIMIRIRCDEDLGLVPETTESDRVDDPVAVALENIAGAARAIVGFRMGSAPRTRGSGGECRRKAHWPGSLVTGWSGSLVQL